MKKEIKEYQKAGEGILNSHPVYGLISTFIGIIILSIWWFTGLFPILVIGAMVFSFGGVVLYNQTIASGGAGKSTNICSINGKRHTTCWTCPYVLIQPNIWNKKANTLQCRAKHDKFNYFQQAIPGWCPHLFRRKP